MQEIEHVISHPSQPLQDKFNKYEDVSKFRFQRVAIKFPIKDFKEVNY